MTLLIDSDFVCFEAASLAEKRSVVVTHKQSGRQKEFDTRTEFWGHWKTKSGGWLAEQNKQRSEKGLEPFSSDDFNIEDKQTSLGMGYAVNVIKTRMESICAKLGTSNVKHFVSGCKSWRIQHSTLLEYKGNRKDSLRPIHLEEVQDYVVNHLGGDRITNGFEVDDIVVMEWHKNKSNVIVAIDKDALGTGALVFNSNKMDSPLDTSGLGKLWIDDKKEIRGWGRKWFYYQCLSADDSDNYAANCFSDVTWGKKSAFNQLDGCHSDKECWQALVNGFKTLYPEPKTVQGWKGDDILIDWKYVLQEMVDMAHMLRWEGDKIIVENVLDKLGISYEQ